MIVIAIVIVMVIVMESVGLDSGVLGYHMIQDQQGKRERVCLCLKREERKRELMNLTKTREITQGR